MGDFVRLRNSVWRHAAMNLSICASSSNYTVMTACMAKCGPFPERPMMLAVFRPVEFMCVEKKTGDFQQAQNK